MTHASRAPATRSNMLRLRRSVAQVMHGAALLKKKRQSLVLELFDRARPAIDARVALEERPRQPTARFSKRSPRAARTAFTSWAGRRASSRSTWSPSRSAGFAASSSRRGRRSCAPSPRAAARWARGTRPRRRRPSSSSASWNPPQDRARGRVPAPAPRELRHVTRLVNTLEQRVVPSLSRGLAGMRRTLDEREREDHMRLRRTGVDEGRTR